MGLKLEPTYTRSLCPTRRLISHPCLHIRVCRGGQGKTTIARRECVRLLTLWSPGEGLTKKDESAEYAVHDELQAPATHRPISDPDLCTTSPQPSTPQDDNPPAQTYTQSLSLENIPMLDSNTQGSAFQAWVDAIPDIASQRDLILTERLDVMNQRTLLYQQEKHFASIENKLVDLVDGTMPDDLVSQRCDELKVLRDEMKTSRQELMSLRQRISGLEDRLSSHEYILTKDERNAYQNIDYNRSQGFLQSTPHASQSLNQTERPPTTPDVTSQDPRDTLYSRMADLRILLDRLHDFEDYLRHELDERDALRASGQVLLRNDAEFFQGARIERADLQKEFDEAQTDVERLKQLCRRKGIEFEDVNFHNPYFPYAEAENIISTLSTQAEATKMPLPESPSGILGAFFSTQERVKNWLLKDPTRSDPTLTGTAEYGTEERARRESDSSDDWCIPQLSPLERRPSSARSAGGHEAPFGMPQWKFGPPPGSERIEALLKESMTETTGKKIRKSI
jgi:hypothetical protein